MTPMSSPPCSTRSMTRSLPRADGRVLFPDADKAFDAHPNGSVLSAVIHPTGLGIITGGDDGRVVWTTADTGPDRTRRAQRRLDRRHRRGPPEPGDRLCRRQEGLRPRPAEKDGIPLHPRRLGVGSRLLRRRPQALLRHPMASSSGTRASKNRSPTSCSGPARTPGSPSRPATSS